jgi:hypothetical protein
MPVLTTKPEHQTPTQARVKVRVTHASWGTPAQIEHSNGAPREPGYGARLAVRKFGAALNKLADS